MKKGRLHNFIRMTALVLVVSLIAGMLPAMPVRADEDDTFLKIVANYVRGNLAAIEGADQKKVENLSDEKIAGFVKEAHPDAEWGSTSMVSVIQAAADEASVKWTADKGTDYAGATIPTNYSLGNLALDYCRSAYAGAALLTDEKIIDLYNGMAAAGNDPFVKLKDLQDQIANSGGGGDAYADKDSSSLIDRSEMVTFQQYVVGQGNVIPQGTLFIGTFLISASVLNDIFYRYATDSITLHDQNVTLYKSELDGGRWKDIDGAAGLSDILPTAETVSELELMPYYISCVVGEDGVPRNARTGAVMNLFEMTNPYDLDKLPEFLSLKFQLDNGVVAADSKNAFSRYTYIVLQRLFAADTEDSQTEFPQAGYDMVKEINGKDMWNENLFSDGKWYRAHTGFLNLVCDWATSGKSHKYILTDRSDSFYSWGKWGSIDRFLCGGRGSVPSGTAAVPIIAGNVNWRDEKWLMDTWGYHGDSGPWWYWGTNYRDDMRPEFYERVNAFEEWYRHFGNTRDEVTRECDEQLPNLYAMYQPMRDAGYRTEADIMMTLMGKVDARRRAEVYYNLALNERNRKVLGPTLLYVLKAVREGRTDFGFNFNLGVSGVGTNEGDFTPVDAVVDTIDDLIMDCQSSYVNYSSASLAEGHTVLAQREYEVSMRIIDQAANSSDYRAVLTDLQQLGDIYSIKDSAIIRRTQELNLIRDLMGEADAQFAGRIHENADAEYQTAQNSQATDAVLEGILKNQKANASGAAAQLQQLIKAECLRVNQSEGEAFINRRLDWCEQQRPGITSDAYRKFATQALEEHIKWLEDILKKVKNGTLLSDEDVEDPSLKTKYEGELLDALDNGDIAAAEAAAGKIAALEATSEASGLGTDDGSAGDTGDGTGGENKLNPGAGDVVKGLEGKVIDSLDDPDNPNLPDYITGLGILGSNRLEELKELLPSDSPPDVIKAMDEAIETAKNSELKGDTGGGTRTGTGGGTGTGDGSGGGNTGAGGAGTGSGNTSGTDGAGTGGNTDGAGTGTGGAAGRGTGSGTDNGAGRGDGSGANGNGAGTGAGAGGLGSGEGDGTVTDAQRAALDGLADQMFGSPFADLPDDEKIAMIVACTRFGRDNSIDGLMGYARELLDEVVDEHNVFVYRQFGADASSEYVSLAAVDRARAYTGYRYVRIGNEVTMTQLIGGAASYTFTIGNDEVMKASGQKATMDGKAVQQKDSYLRGSDTQKYGYIREDDASKYLSDTAEYIDNTDWSALVTESIEKKAQKLEGRLGEIFR